MTPQPRRPFVEPDTPLVTSLEKYVDARADANKERIENVNARVDSVEIRVDRAVESLGRELGAFKAEIRGGLKDVAHEVSSLREQDARHAASVSTLGKVGIGIGVFVGIVAPITSIVVALSQ